MSELINAKNNRGDFRRRLLVSASTLALIGSLAAVSDAIAADSSVDRPIVWIELGGQLQNISTQGDAFDPAFLAANSNSVIFHPVSPLQAEKAPKFAVGGEGKVSFEPAGTRWILSASILYGRSNGNSHVHNQTYTATNPNINPNPPYSGLNSIEKFADTKAQHSEQHAIVDFAAGRDFGLGMFGSGGTSILSLGVRFAQFTSRAHINITARPDLEVISGLAGANWHLYTATAQSRRNFHGLGPSFSWNASKPVVGSQNDGEIALDWGLDAAFLFGRQEVSEQHSTTANRRHKKYNYPAIHLSGHRTLARSVNVPNIGGFAGLSFKYAAAKVSFGYRGDIFFGAIDGGWDTAHRENLSFHGPYATIAVGLGG
jgi:iron complex outermembrane receptor protein